MFRVELLVLSSASSVTLSESFNFSGLWFFSSVRCAQLSTAPRVVEKMKRVQTFWMRLSYVPRYRPPFPGRETKTWLSQKQTWV